MVWTSRMREEEARLRALVDMLRRTQGRGVAGRAERMELARVLRGRIREARAFLNESMSGRDAHEQQMMAFRVRLECPLFSHLESIFTIGARTAAGVSAGRGRPPAQPLFTDLPEPPSLTAKLTK